MGKITQTTSGVTVGHVAVFSDVFGNIKDGGGVPDIASGTVSSVSVATAQGFKGTVANPTTTPAITIETSVTGLLKGNGTGVSAAVADTDYQNPVSLTTTGTSGAATFSGNTLNVPTPLGIAAPLTGYSASSGSVTSADTILTALEKTAGNFQAPISLTTTGTSGAATFSGNTLNVPQYAAGTAIASGVYASRPGSPSANTYYFATDLGTGVLLVYNGTNWKLVTGSAVLAQSGTVETTTATSETNLGIVNIPAGLVSANGKLRIDIIWNNASGSSAIHQILRMGTSGAVSGGELVYSNNTADGALHSVTTLTNNNSQSAQYQTTLYQGNASGVSMTYNGTLSIAMGSQQYLNINSYTGNSSDAVGFYEYSVEWLEA